MTTEQAPHEPTEQWELMEVSGFEPLMYALDRAQQKGYMPDAMADEWAAFNFRAPGALFAPQAQPAAEPQPGQGSAIFNRLRQMVDNLTVALTNDSICVGFTPRQVLLAELNDLCVALDSPPIAATPQQPAAASAGASDAALASAIRRIDALAMSHGLPDSMIPRAISILRAALQSPPVAATEFCWLVELQGPLVVQPSYHTGFTTLTGESRATRDPYEAKRYRSKAEAVKVADKLGFNLVGTWAAVEHGFDSDPRPVATAQQSAAIMRLCANGFSQHPGPCVVWCGDDRTCPAAPENLRKIKAPSVVPEVAHPAAGEATERGAS